MKRPLIPIILALVLAAGAGVAVYFYTRSAESRALQEQASVSVLVSSDAILAGTTLGSAQDAGAVTTVRVPERLRPAQAIESVSAENRALVALADVPAGQMLMSTAFGVAVPQLEAIQVPAGLMAVTVLLEDPQRVGTFLRPGSQIAVFDTVKLPNSDPGAVPVFQTRPLLDRIEVLAVGGVTEQGEAAATSDSWNAKLVTVAVDQQQAEKLIHGSQTGALTMALLGDETTLTPSVGVTDTDVFE